MLSILIPIYNYSVITLVAKLQQQALLLDIDFEIIAAEDGSTKFLQENDRIKNLKNAEYIVLPQNIGRSAIRNKLAQLAKFENLLFVDCDAELNNASYLKNYIPYFNTNKVVLGGVKYTTATTSTNALRVKYGKKREEVTNYFSPFNLLIPKKIFQKIWFNEDIKGYGYEDTLLGHELKELKMSICYIDNKLVHKGIDDSDVFLKKTEFGIQNLYKLYNIGKFPFLKNESKLLRSFIRIKKLRITKLAVLLNNRFIRKNLTGKNPSLFLFDLYKLGILCEISENLLTLHPHCGKR